MSVVVDPVADAAGELARAGVASPRVDAELLAAAALGTDRGRLAFARWDDAALSRFRGLVRRRAAREPVQYLTGGAGFRRLLVPVGPGVFVPRPETESLVSWAVAALRPGSVVVDLCAGSGAIGLALADEVPGLAVHAVERDPVAFRWLSSNCAGTPVRPWLADLADAPVALDAGVDLVVANPPYLPESLAGQVEPEVARHEPPAALWVAGDGLAVLHRVVERAAVLLRPGGHLAVEHGDGQEEGALAALAGGAWRDRRGHPDLAGRPRFVTATRAG